MIASSRKNRDTKWKQGADTVIAISCGGGRISRKAGINNNPKGINVAAEPEERALLL